MIPPSQPHADCGSSRPLPKWTSWALATGVLAFALRILGNVSVVDLDIFHEMALFREILQSGTIPRHDSFSFAPTVYPVVHHEWGMGAVLYFTTVSLGLGTDGLALLRLLLLGTLAVCLVWVAQARGARPGALALLSPLALLLVWPGLSPVRAHLFSFLFLGVLLVLLEKERQGHPRWLLAWPLLFVLWINLHGGFVVGLGLLGVYTLERVGRRFVDFRREAGTAGHGGITEDLVEAVRSSRFLVAAILISFPLLLVNPYGADYIPYLWHALTMERPYITEWQPLWSPFFRGAPLFAFLLACGVFGYTLRGSRHWATTPGLLILLVTALFALRSTRILPFFVVVWLPFVAAALSEAALLRRIERAWRVHYRLLAPLIGVLGVALVGQVLSQGAHRVILPVTGDGPGLIYPAGAVGYLGEVGFSGNLMTPFGVGAYVSWMLHPQVRVGVDSRYEVAYPAEYVEEAIRIYDGIGDWRAFLDGQDTHAVLVRSGLALDSLLLGDGEQGRWLEVYRDDAYAIHARTDHVVRLPLTDRRGMPIQARFP